VTETLVSVWILLSCLAVATLAWMIFVEPRNYEISRRSVSLEKPLGRSLQILHLSDIHFANPNNHLARFFDRLTHEKFDLVMISGDIFDCVDGIPFCLDNLRKLKPKYGTFAVFGNHDYFDYHLWDVLFRHIPGQGNPSNHQRNELLEKSLKESGVRLLKNERVSLGVNGDTLIIYGLDDPVTGHADLGKTMPSIDPNKINLLLTHTVDAFLYIAEGEIDVSFSGHSHGGQIRFPLIGPLITHTRIGRQYTEGIHELKGAICSISRGMGASRFFPLRLLCRPQAILLEVKGKSG